MRVCNRKLLSVGTVLVAFAVAGCAASTFYEAAPSMPSFETEEQLAAARVCQVVYSCCARSCADTRSAYNEPRPANKEFLGACGTDLEECYRVRE